MKIVDLAKINRDKQFHIFGRFSPVYFRSQYFIYTILFHRKLSLFLYAVLCKTRVKIYSCNSYGIGLVGEHSRNKISTNNILIQMVCTCM